INVRLSSSIKDKVKTLCQMADDYIADLKKRDPNACRDISLPLTPNDEENYFDLCKAVEVICDYSRGKMETYVLQPALSLEFTEHVRSFMSSRKLKRDVVGVESVLHGLAVLGARISNAYRGMEYGYIFIDVPNPEVVDYRKLSGMVIGITRSVNANEGSKLSFLVGVSSAIALIYGKTLKEAIEKSLIKVNFVRLTRTGNKVMLKAFEVLDLSSLADRVYRLGIASPIYNLTSKYPPRERHVLRSFIERLSKAVVTYELLDDYTEIYSALRIVTSENFLKELRSYDNWKEIIDNLLQIRVS
ncbi:MAG: hypothetical protein QXM76_05925, partial [Zestosphaera sp.]